MLYPQIMEFVDKLDESDVDVTLTEYARLWHVAHLQASLVREAADAVAELGAFLGSQMSVEPHPRHVAESAPPRTWPIMSARSAVVSSPATTFNAFSWASVRVPIRNSGTTFCAVNT